MQCKGSGCSPQERERVGIIEEVERLQYSALSSQGSVPDPREKKKVLRFIISWVRENFINFAKHLVRQILIQVFAEMKKEDSLSES